MWHDYCCWHIRGRRIRGHLRRDIGPCHVLRWLNGGRELCSRRCDLRCPSDLAWADNKATGPQVKPPGSLSRPNTMPPTPSESVMDNLRSAGDLGGTRRGTAELSTWADDIEEGLRRLFRMTEALLDGMEESVRGSREDNIWTCNVELSHLYAEVQRPCAKGNLYLEPVDAPIDVFDMTKVPGPMDTTIVQQQHYFEMARANLHILKAYLENRVEPKETRVSGIADFLQSNLRRATLKAPEREKDVQNVLEQLLIGRGMEKEVDYDREKWQS